MTLIKYRSAALAFCVLLSLTGCQMQGQVAGTEKENTAGINIEEENGKDIYIFQDAEGNEYKAELLPDVPECTYDFACLETDKNTGYKQYRDKDNAVSSRMGIDVSEFQGESIDWKKVKASGVEFVIIRLGYRAYGESGALVLDAMYEKNIKGALDAGLDVGVYFFSQAISASEAVEEASMAVKLARQYGINMPIAIDSEYANGGAGRADGLSKSARTDITIAFCNTVANAGYKPMVYASKSWFSDHLDVSRFPSSYRIWVAHYAKTCGYTGRYDIWQNTSKGSVDGVKGNVDMNISSI